MVMLKREKSVKKQSHNSKNKKAPNLFEAPCGPDGCVSAAPTEMSLMLEAL
jgi:hypothetical protein